MDFGQADIQALINQGLGFGAAVIGEPCTWFRPSGPANPLDPANARGELRCYFDPDYAFGGKKPNLYGKPLYGALFDRTATLPGDYLQAASGTYFLAAQQPLLPTAAVACNATVTLTRPGGNTASGKQPYGGRRDSTDTPLMTGWPASLLRAGRTIAGKADLPGDVPDGGFEMLLPAWPGVTLRTGDRVADGQGRAFVLSSAELSDLGWRAVCVLAVA